MKPLKLTAVTLALLLNILVFSQSTSTPAFGKVEKEELKISKCEFEDDAEAETLFDLGEFYFDLRFGNIWVQNTRHTRIKIFNDKGLEKANVHIRYINSNEVRIKDLAAQVYNLDGSGNIVTTKLDKQSVYVRKLNKRLSETVFTLPNVKPGSIIEYKYTIDGGEDGNWYFQQDIPVKHSQFTVDFPNEIEFTCTPNCTLPYNAKPGEKSYRNIRTYSMENVPSLKDEPYISCKEDYLQRLETRLIAVNFPGSPRRSLFPVWPQIVKSLMDDEDFGLQLKKNIPRTDTLEMLLKNVKDDYKKMCIIYDYVKKNMEWNEYDNIWALDGVKSAWKDKKGTTGEINLILLNLLRDAGLKAHPTLVSTKDHGVVSPMVPSYKQFNKVVAYVEINDVPYVLDATNKYLPANLIPGDIIASEGLVVEKPETYEWGWKTLWRPDNEYKNIVIYNADIDSTGTSLSGEASVTSVKYARMERMPVIKKGKPEFIKQFISIGAKDISIDSLSFENEKTDSLPLVQHISFHEPLNSSGEYSYLNINLFSGLEKNPFVADNRTSDIFFGFNQSITLLCNINIPKGFQLEEAPKNLRMIMPDTSITFSRISALNEDMLSTKIFVEFKKPVYVAADYDTFKEFYKKMFNLLNEQLIIRRKS